MRPFVLLFNVLSVCTAFIFGGCGTLLPPISAGERSRTNNYGYTPLDPLPVRLGANLTSNASILKALPDETIRLAVGSFEGDAGLTYGPAKVGVAGKSYQVVIDYIKYNTKAFYASTGSKGEESYLKVEPIIIQGIPWPVIHEMGFNKETRISSVVPVYVGVGLRMTANITVVSGNVNLGSLFAIGAAANAKRLSGNLIIQTLGLSGQNITAVIPLPSELNETTLQNAILALGTIKSKIYDPSTEISPRVLAVYNNLGGGPETINVFISAMLQSPIKLEDSQD